MTPASSPQPPGSLPRELARILEAVDARPTASAYLRAATELRAISAELPRVRLALLASFTIAPLLPYLHVELARRGLASDVHVGLFNGIERELMDAESGCIRHHPDIVFVAPLLADRCPAVTHDFLSLDDSGVDECQNDTVQTLASALQRFRTRSDATLIVHNFALRRHPLLGIHEVMAARSQTEAIRELNARLVRAIGGIRGAHVLDFDRLCADVGYGRSYDATLWHLGHAPLSSEALRALARLQAAFVNAALGTPRKCLVLDLDDTLWGGIVAECGVSGVKLGDSYPGSAFREFQQAVLQHHRRGILLAINSKNSQADVDEVFQTHPDMILRREHFACVRANWRTKPENMVDIAAELGIGIDSLVFFDDSPGERHLMRQMLPQVLTLEVPDDPARYADVLLSSDAFEKLSFTPEDRRRAALYRQRAAAQQLRADSLSFEEYLRSLNMAITIRPVDQCAFPRLCDLIQKTNQFNLTTRRHSPGELASMLAEGGALGFTLRVSDRFGDQGVVGAVIVERRGSRAYIESFVLSCRVIGRAVETALLAFVVEHAREHGLTAIEGDYVPTAKNAPAADFYQRHGFAPVQTLTNGTRWRLTLDRVPFTWPDYIQRPMEVPA